MQEFLDASGLRTEETETFPGQCTPVNYASIAIVCNVKGEYAKQVIQEIFQELISLQQQEVKLTFKGFGQLKISKNRQIAFKRFHNGEEDTQEKERDETAVYSIDRASAILSVGGRMSVKSGSFLSSLTSIRTPRSTVSGHSLNSSLVKPTNLWSKLKTKRHISSNADNIFEATPSKTRNGKSMFNTDRHSRVPSHADQPNLILKSARNSDITSDIGSLESKVSIPFPFLENLLQTTKPGEGRTSIKTKFLLEPKQEMLSYIKK